MIRLFTPWYTDSNPQRNEENRACLDANIACADISRIHLIAENDRNLPQHPKVTHHILNKRPTYTDIFNIANSLESGHSIIANTDIYFGSLALLDNMSEGDCFALSRWDITEDGTPVHFFHQDSQDVWIFKGMINNVYGDFEIGRLGCDNRIAYEIQRAGYHITNPSLTLKAYHVHFAIRDVKGNHNKNYVVPPPYLYVMPIKHEPFLTIVTRHLFNRPIMYKQHMESVNAQTDPDFEHVIIYDNIGCGVAKANLSFYRNRKRIKGKYVFMLDDDDVFISNKFVEDLKSIVQKQPNVGMIFVRMYINGENYPTDMVWKKDVLFQNHIGTSNVVVRNDLYQKYIQCFFAMQTGDFQFINTVFKSKTEVYWRDDVVYTKTLRVSRGQAE
jgi:hypothetical protein